MLFSDYGIVVESEPWLADRRPEVMIWHRALSFLAMNLGGRSTPSSLASLMAFANLRLKASVVKQPTWV